MDKGVEIEFEGDRSNPADLRKHAEKVHLANLEKAVDWNDPKSIEAYSAAMEKAANAEASQPSNQQPSYQPGYPAPAPSQIQPPVGRSPQDSAMLAKMAGKIGFAGMPLHKGAEDEMLAAHLALQAVGQDTIYSAS